MSNSVRPHRQQPTRLPLPWDPPGKNTGVGCHFFLQCMKVKSETEVAQSCKTLRDPMDCSLSGSSIHGIFQARVLVIWLLKYRSISSLIGKYCLPIHTSWPPRPFQDPCPKLLTIKRQEDQQQRLSRTLSQCSQSLTKPHSTLISASEKCVRVCVCVKVAQSCPTLCDPMDFPGKNTGEGCHFLLQMKNKGVEWVVWAALRLQLCQVIIP